MAAGTPDHTAARVALWRALHVELDAPPHVLEDTVGLELLAPPADWRSRGDMHPERMKGSRASIVARARFVEDLVESSGVAQDALLGAGLDTFAQRRPELASKLKVFEVERPDTQAWKRERLVELGLGVPAWLKLVPVNFENQSWWAELVKAGFDSSRPAVISSLGVAMYLSKEANLATLKQVATMAPGSSFAMSFMLPLELLEPAERPGIEAAMKGAAAAGTPFLSSFAPQEAVELARQAGFKAAQHVSHLELAQRYFAGRSDGLRPGSEQMLVATM